MSTESCLPPTHNDGLRYSVVFECPGFITQGSNGLFERPGNFVQDICQAVPNGDGAKIAIPGHYMEGEPWLPGLGGYATKGGLFDPNDTSVGLRAIVVTPKNRSSKESGEYEYAAQIEWISN